MRNLMLVAGMLGLVAACAPASAWSAERTYDDAHLQPIAGGFAPGESLLQGEWRVVSIVGRQPIRDTLPQLRFQDTRISGDTGCNSFGGGFRFERGYLTTSTLSTTRRACPGRLGAQEQNMLALLGQRLSVSNNRAGRLVMTNRGGQTLVLARP